MPTDVSSLSDLAAAAEVTPRTIRYYISQGLLPGPFGQGSAARYTPAHLARLRAIRHLADAGLSLARIRDHLSRLAEDEIAELARASVDPASAAPAEEGPGAPALAYIRGVLGSQRGPAPQPPTLLANMAREPIQGRYEPGAPDEFSPLGSPDVRMPTPGPFPARPAPTLMPPQSSPWGEPGAERSTWERIALTPDIEIHVRRPLDRRSHRLLEQLLAAAHRLFGGR